MYGHVSANGTVKEAPCFSMDSPLELNRFQSNNKLAELTDCCLPETSLRTRHY
jgi:hypothetical protein